MKILKIIKKHILEEGKKRKRQQQAQQQAKEKEAQTRATQEQKPNEIYYDSNFYERITLALGKNNRTSDLNKVDRSLEQIKQDGKVTLGGVHSIGQALYSERAQESLTGWVVVPISRKNDLRLGYKRHDDGVFEVKFGTARQLGYKH